MHTYNPTGVASTAARQAVSSHTRCARNSTQPRWGRNERCIDVPRVAVRPQPWALLLCPVGASHGSPFLYRILEPMLSLQSSCVYAALRKMVCGKPFFTKPLEASSFSKRGAQQPPFSGGWVVWLPFLGLKPKATQPHRAAVTAMAAVTIPP